jgi:hypothetical protein
MNKFELDQLTGAPAVHEQVVSQPEQEKVCCSRVSPHHGQTVLSWLRKKEREGVIRLLIRKNGARNQCCRRKLAKFLST